MLYREVSALRFKDNSKKRIKEVVPYDVEFLLKINEKTKKYRITPKSLKAFTIGYLFGNGIVKSLKNIHELKIDGKTIIVKVDKDSLPLSPVKSKLKISTEDVFESFKSLEKNAKIWKITGGTHIAGLISDGNKIFEEDISRHAAIDKVLGHGILKNLNFSESFVVYSGRVSDSLILKLTRLGIPIVISNAAPMYSALSLAKDYNITIVGFVRDRRFNVYTCPHRISL